MNTNTSFGSIAAAYKRKNQNNLEHSAVQNNNQNDTHEEPLRKKPIINAFNKYEIQKRELANNPPNKYLKNNGESEGVKGQTRRKPKMVNVSKNQKGNKLTRCAHKEYCSMAICGFNLDNKDSV